MNLPAEVGPRWVEPEMRRDRFRPLESLSAYATTFRYSLTPTPKIDDLQRLLATLLELYKTARTELLTETG